MQGVVLEEDEHGDGGDGELENEFPASGEAAAAFFADFEVVVDEADAAKKDGDAEEKPDVVVAQIGPAEG